MGAIQCLGWTVAVTRCQWLVCGRSGQFEASVAGRSGRGRRQRNRVLLCTPP